MHSSAKIPLNNSCHHTRTIACIGINRTKPKNHGLHTKLWKRDLHWCCAKVLKKPLAKKPHIQQHSPHRCPLRFKPCQRSFFEIVFWWRIITTGVLWRHEHGVRKSCGDYPESNKQRVNWYQTLQTLTVVLQGQCSYKKPSKHYLKRRSVKHFWGNYQE